MIIAAKISLHRSSSYNTHFVTKKLTSVKKNIIYFYERLYPKVKGEMEEKQSIIY